MTAASAAATSRWKIGDVAQRFFAVAALADEHGYIACIFGSTVKYGEGRDLDVLMVSRFREKQDHAAFLAAFGGEVVKTFERPERGNHSYEVAKDGRLFHFVFGRF